MQELTRSINQQLALITTHINDRMGLSGPVRLYDHADLQGHHLQNYPDAPPTGSAASVAQLQAIQALIDDLQRQANAIQARLLQVAGLTTSAPSQIDAGDTATVGTSPLASPGDHQHAAPAALAGDLAAVASVAAAGVSTKLVRADHVHVIASNTVTDAILRDSAAVSILGRSANSSGDPADIAAAANGNVLRRAANVVGFGQIDVSDGTNVVSGILAMANGGTGSATLVLSSGTYTPTLTGVTNVTASTAYVCQYHRVGSVVSVAGKVDVDPTAPGLTQLGISLPVASNFAAAEQCGGAACAPGIAGEAAALLADATNDRAEMDWTTVDITNQSFYFTFSYLVI